jgi:hypothetical protein
MTKPKLSYKSSKVRIALELTADFEDKIDAFRKKQKDPASHEAVDELITYMHRCVNGKRAFLFSKEAISKDYIRMADTTSAGHVDYERKFALRCADLVVQHD